MPAIRPHSKTRTGCKNCKSRKVKCDERRPSCFNCTKRSLNCDLTPKFRCPRSIRELSPLPASIDQGLASGDGPALQLADLELLHHYSISTSYTITPNPVLRTLWQVNVVQIGFQHEFVLRSVLALSALHCARLNPQKRDFYISQAMIHHQIASRKAMSLFSNITEENGTALYAFSILTTIFGLASPRNPDNFMSFTEEGIAEWMYLHRGTRKIVALAEKELKVGSLTPMFTMGARRAQSVGPESSQSEHLTQLRSLIMESTIDVDIQHIYLSSIDSLRRSFNQIYNISNHPADLVDIFIWPFQLSEEFLALLKQHRNEALVIFVFFSVLLKHFDGYWFLEGWSIHLISRIYHILDHEHRLWIRWPMEEIGWTPGVDHSSEIV
ncbi:hypothetical protein FQN57_004750 [Myotisia sp. PD_48]|nr:hypothetical protein FQN57_004750 [Myotisia sp. PD_48]